MKPLVLNISTPFSERSLPIQVFSFSGSTSPKRSIAIEPTSSSCSCSACQNLSVLNGISLFSSLLMTFILNSSAVCCVNKPIFVGFSMFRMKDLFPLSSNLRFICSPYGIVFPGSKVLAFSA